MEFDLSLTAEYGVGQRLSPLIERVLAPNPGPYTFRGTGVYIVGAGDTVAVIDPGPDLPEHNAALKRVLGARTVSHILITHGHSDHVPAARPLQDWCGAQIYGYGAQAQTNDVEEAVGGVFVPDVTIGDGARIPGDGFTLECVFTPGHTANHICYALAQEKALFTGDHVMGWSTTVIAPPDGNMGDYMRSLEKLIARDDAILYPTHGSPITRTGSFLRAYLTHRRMREVQIADAIARGIDAAPALVDKLYAGLPPALHKAAALTVQAHLEHMVEERRIAALPDGRYRLSA